MYYVYIIKSTKETDNYYVGYTQNLSLRLKQHNTGNSTHTSKFEDWSLVFYAVFPNKLKALDFEKYLKSHSGRIFMQKRLC